MAKARLHHFDMLKGIAIFLVVMGHVLTMCIRDIDSAVLFKMVEKIHMPLFFFISGYFTYKLTENGKVKSPNLFSRAKQLLVPFFVVSILWIYYFPNSGLQSPFISTWDGLFFVESKNGYWFTLCLFELILLYSLLTPLFSLCRKVISRFCVILLVWLGLLIITHYLQNTCIYGLLGLQFACEFFPIFMLGTLAKAECVTFDKITASNRGVTVALLLGSVLMYFVCWPWEINLSYKYVVVVKQFLYPCVILVAISIVKPWGEKAFDENNPKGTIIARLFEYIGTQSLAVYLLHYFFLFPLPILRGPLLEMNLNIVPTFIVAAFFAIIIIAVTLCVNYIVSKSKLFALILTGKIN